MTRVVRGALWLLVALCLAFAAKTGDYDRRFFGLLLAGVFAAWLAAKPLWSRVGVAAIVGVVVLPLWFEGLRQGGLGFGFADKGVGPALFAAFAAVAVSSRLAAYGYVVGGLAVSVPALAYLSHPELSSFHFLCSPQSALLASVLGCVSFAVVLRVWRSTQGSISFFAGVLIAVGLTWVIDRAIVLSRLL